MDLLVVDGLRAYYGGVCALKGIELKVGHGEIVCLIGSNGAGKSTTLMAISGIVKKKFGKILYEGQEIQEKPAAEIVRLGIVQVPEGRRIFAGLTVLENLELAGYFSGNAPRITENLNRVLELFPRLKERINQSGGTLSGGEQQMLAIGRALMANPQLLLLDEPSLGLSPKLQDEIFRRLKQINESGISILLVEQNAHRALDLSHRAYVMETGNITMSGPAKDLKNDPAVKRAYLGEG
ncbi:MAG: ABC transporter ATP-binding protein [bacterium JZ-2024 1]